MKKSLLLLLALLLLVFMAYWFTQKDQTTSIYLEDRDFIVENEDDLAYITLNIKNYPLIHLQREENSSKWILNNKYYADKNIVSNLTGVMSKMQIKYIPPQTMTANIMKDIEQIGIEVQGFDKAGKTLAHFIVGSNDSKELSTFCVRKGAKQPYAMHVSVAEGGLRNYFAQTQKDLRDKSIFDIQSEDITSLKMSYKRNLKESFLITKNGGEYELKDYFGDIKSNGNQRVLKAYFQEYNSVASEAIRTGEISMDSIQQYLPFASLEINLKNGEELSFDFYPLLDIVDNQAETNSIDDLKLKKIERYFVYASNGDVFIVQHRLVKAFFRPLDYFQL